MCNFQKVFLVILFLFANLFVVLVYKLETFTNCKEVKITIMIIAIIYIFYLMRYLIISWKLLSQNPQLPPEKIHLTAPPSPPPFLFTPPLKIQKVQVPTFCLHSKFFWPLRQKGVVEDTMLSLVRMVSFFPILVQ